MSLGLFLFFLTHFAKPSITPPADKTIRPEGGSVFTATAYDNHHRAARQVVKYCANLRCPLLPVRDSHWPANEATVGLHLRKNEASKAKPPKQQHFVSERGATIGSVNTRFLHSLFRRFRGSYAPFLTTWALNAERSQTERSSCVNKRTR